MSFKSWCQRARIAEAIERLSMNRNASVKQLAADLGYASFSAFSHAFRQVTGKSPTEFTRGEVDSAARIRVMAGCRAIELHAGVRR